MGRGRGKGSRDEESAAAHLNREGRGRGEGRKDEESAAAPINGDGENGGEGGIEMRMHELQFHFSSFHFHFPVAEAWLQPGLDGREANANPGPGWEAKARLGSRGGPGWHGQGLPLSTLTSLLSTVTFTSLFSLFRHTSPSFYVYFCLSCGSHCKSRMLFVIASSSSLNLELKLLRLALACVLLLRSLQRCQC